MNNETQIVALSIDKVQTFLTETIHAHVQEKQTEEATLKQIMNASREVSQGFQNTVKEAFSVQENEVLLSCSGVYIFRNPLPEKEIHAIFNKLFFEYYQESQGQKWLRCVSFPQGKYDEIQAIQEAKKRLKQSNCLNARIEENKDKLFKFCKIDAKDAQPPKDDENYPMFAEDINALFSGEEGDNKNRFRIAVIKADLDGMGNMFKEIKSYESYSRISKILSDKVSLKGLHEMAEKCRPEGRTGWLFPFYIAGDDIFFAVSMANLTKGTRLCREILVGIKQSLEKEESSKPLSISIGVEITFNREPIRYYMEMVERQLKHAKEENTPKLLKQFVKAKISIGGLAFLDIDYNAMKTYKQTLVCMNKRNKKGRKNNRCNKCENCRKRGEIDEQLQAVPIWDYFLNDVYRINAIRSNDTYDKMLGTSGFFYTLLDRLADDTVQQDNRKYINSVLYHLLPKYLNSSDKKLRELEVVLNGRILSQLMRKNWGKGMNIVLNEKSKHRLETYLRLMLLFSDNRFQLIPDVKSKLDYSNVELENSRKYLLSKSADYLYRTVLERRNKPLRDIFIKKENYQTADKKTIPCFQRLKLEKSMFVRMRDTDKVPVEKAANMIELKNGYSADEIKKANRDREQGGKSPCLLYFNKGKFLELAHSEGEWNSDFIDSLMLFYEYKEMSIRFNEKKKSGGGNAK